MHGLEDRPDAIVLGCLMAVVVVGLFLVLDQRIGVLGGFSGLVERVTGRASELSWRVWFLFGAVAGGFAFVVAVGARPATDSYGWLSKEFDSDLPVIGALVFAGVLIGYGTKVAGGCTSGNGIGGCSTGNPGSLVATATFMGTAIAASLLIQVVT